MKVERLERWEARLRAELEDVWSRYTRVAGQLAHARFVKQHRTYEAEPGVAFDHPCCTCPDCPVVPVEDTGNGD